MRIAASVEYDGTHFNGWQSQPDGRTVQDVLEKALGAVADARIATVCAGRTDAGVHAVSQVVHFDTSASRSIRSWVLGTNSALPEDIAVRWVQPMSDDFHARFSAVSRSYRYVILNRGCRSALLRHRACFSPRPLDESVMESAGRALLGTHDFSAFRAASCQAHSPSRAVHALSVRRHGDFVVIDISANAFLQNMVRIVAGVLMRVGRLEEPAQWVEDILMARDRRHLGITAPPGGLYLTGVEYAPGFGIPQPDLKTSPVLPDLAGIKTGLSL
ncbi:MAG: tRNA pseudouridine(38-40) synthase TruA [Gammaproteobacteria bacterium]|nr:tRNA pseudouridine(38-40) synthase TruA [Gammaproteobacteria bacterium]